MGMKLPELIFPIQTTSTKSLTVKLEYKKIMIGAEAEIKTMD